MIILSLDGSFRLGDPTDTVTELQQLDAVLGAIRKQVSDSPDVFLAEVANMAKALSGKKPKSLVITSELRGNTLVHEFKLS